MFDFLNKIFGRETSSATAKERLRLVLLSDHLSLAPDVVESLKHDLVEVISRYVEVDAANCDVSFEQQDKQIAMLANIPILGMRSRPTPPPAPPSAPTSASAPTDAEQNVTLSLACAEPVEAKGDRQPTQHEPPANGQPRRRRRKRRSVGGSAAPQPT